MEIEQDEFVGRSEITKIVQSLKDTDVNFRNYEKIKDKTDSTHKMIYAQIQNLTRGYSQSKQKFTELTSKDSFKNRSDRGIVELEIYELMEQMLNNVKEAFSWKSIDVELNTVLTNKMFKLMTEAKIDEINRDAVKETKTMITQLNEFYVDMLKEIMRGNKDITESKIRMLDEKIVSTARYLEERSKEERKDIINLFSAFVDKYAKESKEIKDMVKNIEVKVGRPMDKTIQEDIFKEDIHDDVIKKPVRKEKQEDNIDDIDDHFENFFGDEDKKGEED